MENREIITAKEKQEKDSLGLKIAMAILAVAVVVLTLINAAPFGAKGESKAAEITEPRAVVTRNVHRANNVKYEMNEIEEVAEGKSEEGEENLEGKFTVDGVSVETSATAAIA